MYRFLDLFLTVSMLNVQHVMMALLCGTILGYVACPTDLCLRSTREETCEDTSKAAYLTHVIVCGSRVVYYICCVPVVNSVSS